MRSHEPADYQCPVCVVIAGGDTEISGPDNIVYRDAHTIAMVAPHWPNPTTGNLLVAPTSHIENLYAADDQTTAALAITCRLMATTLLDATNCEGVSIRQNNEPSGGQSMWHLHTHVIPRWDGDGLDRSTLDMHLVTPTSQRSHVELIRATLARNDV